MHLFRVLGLVFLGAVGGVAGAAAVFKRVLPSSGDELSDEVALVAIFDGVELESRASGFRGGSMLAWFGGVAVDLREASLAPGAHLSVHSFFGGVAIRVPSGWRIESSLHALAGGVEVRSSEPDDPAAPTLTVEGLAVFGGIAVGSRADDDAEAT
ncbi:MAG TPA: LiaF domain-containing protein [Gaiellaceae bacterium]|nr:LiaF domain-containing protein [Gaiellaceae bacterium]